MKVGDVLSELDHCMVAVSNGRGDRNPLYYGPCDMPTALRLAQKELAKYKTVSIEFMSTVDVVLGDD
jgi:hypothetical protein